MKRLPILLLLFSIGCGGAPESQEASPAQTVEQQAWELIRGGAVLVDVRSAAEVANGSLDGALHIPHDEIGERLAEIGDDKSVPIVLFCAAGGRAGRAAAELAGHGYQGVLNAGGYEALKAAQ